MTDPGSSLAQRFLRAGVPLTLLLDLHDPDGLRVALAAELAASDVAGAPVPALRTPIRLVQTA